MRPVCNSKGIPLLALASSESASSTESSGSTELPGEREYSEVSQFHIYKGLYRNDARGNLSAEFTRDRTCSLWRSEKILS